MMHLLARASGILSAGVVSWLLTYLLHSTLLLGGTWVLLRLRPMRPEWEETLWKLATFGALVTATAHSLLDCDPFVDSWDPTHFHPGAGHVASTALASDAGAVLHHWLLALTLVWLTGSVIRLAELTRRQRRLLRALAGRRPAGGEVLEALRVVAGGLAARLRTRLRLTTLRGLGTPLALGRREVVVPPDLAERLDDAPLRGVIAHEVAHLVRGDPLWALAAGVVEAVCFFQPLNRVARRRLAELAEIQADGWAVRRTGAPLAVARGLEGVARTLAEGGGPARAGLAAMGEGRLGLAERILRILEPDPAEARPVGHAPRLGLAGAALLTLLLAAPSFSSIHDADDDARRASDTAVRMRAPIESRRQPRLMTSGSGQPRPRVSMPAGWDSPTRSTGSPPPSLQRS
ncbi:MAG: M56 family metallopeptidase [Candidatus Palauibacterales bacterium]|nr:M56 family metallopeptidase [Candidatus Palauibacterales bacterium]MDP2582810.1 M56 family metallopeptidase [Candidatus Palauibacterales bacterium]